MSAHSGVSGLDAILRLVPLIGCAVLLRWCFKDKTGVEPGHDMGHEYDGIRELNNPLPKWWTYLFVSTIVCLQLFILLYTQALATLKVY